MMLENTLKDIHQNVKIGASGGGFIYCGNSDDIDYLILDRSNMKVMASYLQTRKSDISRIYKKISLETDYGQIVNLKQAVKRNEESIENILDEMLGYKSVSERKVIATYPSIDEKDTLIIIIEGNEGRGVWTTKEYERSYK